MITISSLLLLLILLLLYMCYVPDVSVKIYVNDWPTTDDRTLAQKNSNGNISTTGHLIHFMFGSRVGFSGLMDWMALFAVKPITIGMYEKTMREE